MLVTFKPLHQQYYNNIFQKAAHNLHKDTANTISEYVEKGMYVLDFGCGEGAFSSRLKDMNLKVDSCDIDTDQFKATVDNLIKLDLNRDNIADNFDKKYDMVIGMEIIEHLENPRKYIRDIKKLVKPGGTIVITTPNITSFESRLRFFMKGNFVSFEEKSLAFGHITPLSPFQLETIFKESNLKVLKRTHGGTLPVFDFSFPGFFTRFRLARNFVLPLFRPFMSGITKGRSVIYVLKSDL
ncbi:MAG: class I SAM-dependent methyltransferase [Bacteroidales bacterium]|jgi:2-polyprenyl-3-methyl-5-hydroxy-6-metoxy-1,4-benzoquinol methylase|nr:class I SAM-dependent methyltransferase [Bacteroidales bacterium]